MFFKHKMSFSSRTFLKYYKKVSKIVSESPIKIPRAVVDDIVPMMSVISGYATVNSGKEMDKTIKEPLKWWLNYKKTDELKRAAIKRIEFYESIADGKPLNGDCLLDGKAVGNAESPATRCVVAFCDCWLSPDYINDYGNGAITIHDISNMAYFAKKTVIPLINQMNDLYMDIYKCA